MITSVNEIISEVIDLCGGAQLDYELAANMASLHVLNAIDDMELQLVSSSRGQNRKKVAINFQSSRTGTVNFLPNFVRYKITPQVVNSYTVRWRTISIVNDAEDLTSFENENKEAIFFTEVQDSDPTLWNYELSFRPVNTLLAEMWGPLFNDIDTLEDNTSFPALYSRLASVRATLFMLDDLLLMPNYKDLIPFIQSRKQSLEVNGKMLNHRWDVFRTGADADLGENVSAEFDPFGIENLGALINY